MLSSCASTREPVTRAQYWPFLTDYENPETNGWRTRGLGPLVERSGDNEGRSETSIAPFYNYTYDPVAKEREAISLYPFGRYRERWRDDAGEDIRSQRFWLLPFFYYNYFSAVEGEEDYDYYAPFPIVAGGSDTREGPYFALIPIAGTVKGHFGVDQFDFLMGPLYVHTRDGDINKWYLPFPLIWYGTGPGYSSWGVLPLYSESFQEGHYERHNLLWPLIAWGRDGLSTAHPQTYWQVLPFVGNISTDQSDVWSVLWPFFHYGRYENTDTTIIDAPWPIFRWAEGLNYSEFRLWPLYSKWRRNNQEGWDALWPFIWYTVEKDPLFTESRFFFAPFWQQRDREYVPDSAGEIRTLKTRALWPLISYRKEADDSYTYTFPYILPFLDKRFERQYRKILNIVTAQGDSASDSLEILWGMYNHTFSDDESWAALHPLFTNQVRKYRSPDEPRDGPHPRDEESFNLLYGLLGHETSPDQKAHKVKYLWFGETEYLEEDPLKE